MKTPKPKQTRKTLREKYVRCRVCSCSDLEACNPPCTWAGGGGLCSGCYTAAHFVAEWLQGAHRPNITALLNEAADILNNPGDLATFTSGTDD